MVFWRYFDSVYNLFSTLSGLYAEGQEKMRKTDNRVVDDRGVEDISSEVDKDQKIVNFDDNLEDGFAKVVFKGQLYEVDLDKVKEIPPNQNPEVYIQNNKDEYLVHAFERYKEFVKEDREYVGIFLYGDMVFGADENIVKQGLNECLEYFIDTEDYESASEVRDLLEEIEPSYE